MVVVVLVSGGMPGTYIIPNCTYADNVIVNGTITIDSTNTNALLVEKDDGTDIFKVDTSNDWVYTGNVRPRSHNNYDIGQEGTRYRTYIL